MSFAKSAALAVLVAATGLGATMTAASAHSKKYKYKYYGHHHHHYKSRDFVAGALVGAAVVGAANYESCKKWKYRYQRTGNPAFLDRYYACKY